jgi:glycosyltransferase involved in cell wall biosynthesis
LSDSVSRGSGPEEGRAPRCTVLLPGVPYPATHGGEVDRWNRLVSLRRAGLAVQAVIWTSDGLIPPESLRALSDLGCSVVAVPRKRRPIRFLLGHPPGRLDSFRPTRHEWSSLRDQVLAFKPDLLLAESLEPSLPAQELVALAGARLVYRSQNVEHLYWQFQGRLARGFGKLPFLLAIPGLQRAEMDLREKADLVLDISEEDRNWWISRGHTHNSTVVPPIWLGDGDDDVETPELEFEVSFTGNLYTPNNVDGVVWFCEAILPRARTLIGRELRVVFAGSKPSDRLVRVAMAVGAKCIANPVSLGPIRASSGVLINPVRYSSGVNVKMLEMLASGRPIVSTSAGARGLPRALRETIIVCDDPEAFAGALVSATASAPRSQKAERRVLLERECGSAAMLPLLAFAATLRHQ